MKTNMTSEQKTFCEKHSLTEDQFFGTEKIGGSLYLRSLTAIPDGFNPTVGGYLYLGSLTAIPDGFNPTVGGYLYLGSSLKSKYTKIDSSTHVFTWQDERFIRVDGILCEVLIKRRNDRKVKIAWSVEESWLTTDGKYWSHGKTLKEAKSDLQFKVISEKLKSEPINADTEVTVAHYRAISGACDFGVRNWLQSNGIPFKVEKIGDKDRTVEEKPMKAKEVLELLRKTNAYGLERFEKLITF